MKFLFAGMRAVLLVLGALRGLSAQAEPLDTALLRQGEQVARTADCQACHTAPGSNRPYSGGYGLVSPVGVLYSTNITPDKSGIGAYSEAQFVDALRRGIRPDGTRLYPAMPYTAYAMMSDADLHALYYYLKYGVKAQAQANPATALPFPFNWRFGIRFWNMMFVRQAAWKSDSSKSAEWNRGNYLVNGPGHCGVCHTPRGFLLQEQSDRPLAGGRLGIWHAPNITSDTISGIGGWSDEALLRYLKTGRAPGKGQAGGGMAEVIGHSLQYLPDSDVRAIVTYLKATAPIRNQGDSAPAFSYGAPYNVENALRGRKPNQADSVLPDGAALFSGNCASCHQPDGSGSANQAYPSLFHNSVTGRRNPNNLIAAILFGVQRNTVDHQVLMPGFGAPSYVNSLNDQQIAAISNFVLAHYGNPDIKVTARNVEWVRKGGYPPLLARLQPWVIPGLSLAIMLLIALIIWRAAARRRP